MTGSNIWDQVLARIETKVNRHSFYTWFKPTTFVSDLDGAIRVRVPNALFRDWLTKHYAAAIEEALTEVQRTGAPVSFVTDEMPAPPPLPPVVPPEPEPDEVALLQPAVHLRRRRSRQDASDAGRGSCHQGAGSGSTRCVHPLREIRE